MPTITIASRKGGVGKSTAAFLLATELAKGADVIAIDADPNAPIATWGKKGRLDNLEIIHVGPDDEIMDLIDNAARRATFVVVDTEGVADLRVADAISVSDFVVVPSQGSILDQDGAAGTIRLIRREEKKLKRPIPFAVLITRASGAIRTGSMIEAEKQLAQQGIDVFETRIIERDAFRAMFSYQTTLDGLPAKVRNIDKARDNARTFAYEVVKYLKAPELKRA